MQCLEQPEDPVQVELVLVSVGKFLKESHILASLEQRDAEPGFKVPDDHIVNVQFIRHSQLLLQHLL